MEDPPDEEHLIVHGHNVWVTFNTAHEALEKNGSIISAQPDAALLRSEMQRFQLLAINLGLFRQDHTTVVL